MTDITGETFEVADAEVLADEPVPEVEEEPSVAEEEEAEVEMDELSVDVDVLDELSVDVDVLDELLDDPPELPDPDPFILIVHFLTSRKAFFPSASVVGVKVIMQVSVIGPASVGVFVIVITVVVPSLFCLVKTGAAVTCKAKKKKSR